MVEKMEVDEPTKATEQKPTGNLEQTITFENLRDWCSQLEKGESHLGRVLQFLGKTRANLNSDVLSKLVTNYFAVITTQRDALLQWVPSTAGAADTVVAMEVDSPAPATPKVSKTPKAKRTQLPLTTAPVPEVELYIHLLVLIHLVDGKKYKEAEECARLMIERVDFHDKRTLDPIAAKGYFYYSLCYERTNRFDELRSYLSGRLRTATLRRLSSSQAVLIVCLLRCYLLGKHYPAAAKLVTKVTFPEGASNNELARYFYYQGRIKAMQLDYTAAAGYFMQALRKAPQDAAIGFKQNVQKWIVVISLLQGEIPERSIFRVPIYRKPLLPYLELTQAVRLGDLGLFEQVLLKHGSSVFKQDETVTLIVRLRQNVIRTAVRQISLAYTRISIKDICKKLQLSSDVEAEYMVAKAIKDGTIDASISADNDSSERYMQSNETEDIYRTVEPQLHYDTRIKYCLELHNQAVKALRYPPNIYAKNVESIEEQREREQQELDYAKEMAEEDDDDF
uniref:PCI domain-containing protein n=1 Tax=Steinernema glaseri TaxID=37863 RepID=A0A1I7Z7H0_9BILA